ncbi:MAG: hypothetical protein COA52_18720 [Hyphomicrobiales bacterium]|nr:MAG: hypothetical protein COA52_18720 [Hyphomicrobiales bacterium]
MISQIKIENFQRIDKEIQIDLAPLTVLVGENGAGKSSILKALHWSIRCATLSDANEKVTLEQMDYVPSKEFLELGHKLKLQNSSAGRHTTVTLVNEEFENTKISIRGSRNDAGVHVKIDGPLKTILTNDTSPSTAFIPGLSGLAEEETILAIPVMHRKASSGEGGSALRQIILQYSEQAGGTGNDYRELEDLSLWVGKVLPGVQFWVKFDRLRDRNIDVRFLTPDMKVPGQGYRVAWKSIEMAGTGFLQVVQIFAYLLYFKPRLLLVDEPDAHLHPTSQQALIRALSDATEEFPETQIVVSTHSPNLVRALPQDARIHWISAGVAKAEGTLVREKMGWSALDKELIIFSEDGNSKYIDSILSTRREIQNRCLIWPTFGKDSLPNGSKAKQIAKRMGVKILIHRDRDFMSNEDVVAWSETKAYHTCDVEYWVPSGSDIESLFVDVNHIRLSLGVSSAIAQEIHDEALSSFDETHIRTTFTHAYQSAVSKLPTIDGRDAVSRWMVLGGFTEETIKGKEFLKAVKKACGSVLPKHGLGQYMNRLKKIGQSDDNNPVASDLLDLLSRILDD